MKNTTLRNEKIYLDQLPEINDGLKQFCIQLDLDTWGSGAKNFLFEIACRRADGFIPHSHNHGGFDVYNILESVCGEDEDGSDDSLLLHGFRFMYEGETNGIHTLCAYYCQWDEGDIYGINRAKTIKEIEITFKKTDRLIAKLNKFVKECI